MSRSAPLVLYTNVILSEEVPSLHINCRFISRGNLVRAAVLSDETVHTTMLRSVRDIAMKANKSEEEKKNVEKGELITAQMIMVASVHMSWDMARTLPSERLLRHVLTKGPYEELVGPM